MDLGRERVKHYCNITRGFSISRYVFFFCFLLHPDTLSYDINYDVNVYDSII